MHFLHTVLEEILSHGIFPGIQIEGTGISRSKCASKSEKKKKKRYKDS